MLERLEWHAFESRTSALSVWHSWGRGLQVFNRNLWIWLWRDKFLNGSWVMPLAIQTHASVTQITSRLPICPNLASVQCLDRHYYYNMQSGQTTVEVRAQRLSHESCDQEGLKNGLFQPSKASFHFYIRLTIFWSHEIELAGAIPINESIELLPIFTKEELTLNAPNKWQFVIEICFDNIWLQKCTFFNRCQFVASFSF